MRWNRLNSDRTARKSAAAASATSAEESKGRNEGGGAARFRFGAETSRFAVCLPTYNRRLSFRPLPMSFTNRPFAASTPSATAITAAGEKLRRVRLAPSVAAATTTTASQREPPRDSARGRAAPITAVGGFVASPLRRTTGDVQLKSTGEASQNRIGGMFGNILRLTHREILVPQVLSRFGNRSPAFLAGGVVYKPSAAPPVHTTAPTPS